MQLNHLLIDFDCIYYWDGLVQFVFSKEDLRSVFLVSRAIQLSWVIWFHSNPCWKTAVILFNPSLGDKWVQAFSKVIRPKLNIIARVELGVTHFKAAVQCVSHFTTQTLLRITSIIPSASKICNSRVIQCRSQFLNETICLTWDDLDMAKKRKLQERNNLFW